VYNGERHLEATIRSILGQTLTDLELVITDNASTDATHEICRDYALLDGRVRYHRQDVNVGCRGNFHLAFALGASGEYFKWAGHDDQVEPTYLARCVAHLDAHPGDVLCTSRVRMVDGDDRPVDRFPEPASFHDPSPHLRMRALFAVPATYQTIFGVIRRSTLAATHLFGPWYASDRALQIELSLQGGFGLVPDRLFVSRDHEGRGDYVDDKVAWYTPERAGSPEAGYWHHLWWVSRALATAPLSPADRALCTAELTRRASGKAGVWLPVLARQAAATATSRARARVWGRKRHAERVAYKNMYSNNPWPSSPSTV
jgi:glycosyltransferase involved in cell wall biosynthesis